MVNRPKGVYRGIKTTNCWQALNPQKKCPILHYKKIPNEERTASPCPCRAGGANPLFWSRASHPCFSTWNSSSKSQPTRLILGLNSQTFNGNSVLHIQLLLIANTAIWQWIPKPITRFESEQSLCVTGNPVQTHSIKNPPENFPKNGSIWAKRLEFGEKMISGVLGPSPIHQNLFFFGWIDFLIFDRIWPALRHKRNP